MKKYLIFMLLALISIGARAESVDMSFSETDQPINTDWKFAKVSDTDLNNLQEGDFIVVSFNATSKGNQYSVKTGDGKTLTSNGTKAYLYWTEENENRDYHTCGAGEKDFTFTVTTSMLSDFQAGKGLRIEYNGLSGLGIKRVRMSENWRSYKPTDKDNYQEIMSTPQYIKDWYSGAYCLQGNYYDKKGYTLRVVCLETADDSYAYLKKNDDAWSAIMSGSDKFSIAGWKYFEITLNQELLDIIYGDGLLIGGNNYFIAGIYVYGNYNDDVETWSDGDVVDTYDANAGLKLNITSGTWNYYDIPGAFFEYQNNSNGQISDVKIANTKNNIIRVNYSDAKEGAQLTAIDNYQVDTDGKYASYIRERVGEEYYKDHFECASGTGYKDFELSDAVTVFDPIVNETYNSKVPVTGEAGVKKGMLSTLLQHGMRIGGNHMTVTSVQIRHSRVSKYVSGYAVYNRSLSNTIWKAMSLPYNLTKVQWQAAFGNDVKICELGRSSVTKADVSQGNISNAYGITLRFKELDGDLNANYPYIIKLGSANERNSYAINGVKADVRDFQSYEFRTGDFDVSALTATDPAVGSDNYDRNHRIYVLEQQIKDKLKPGNKVCMMFQSTAPEFTITNPSPGEVEKITNTNLYTNLYVPQDLTNDNVNYVFSDGELYPIVTVNRRIKSGLAYIKFPPATNNLFNESSDGTQGVSLAKNVKFSFDDDNTTGIEEITSLPKKQDVVGIYSLDGQIVRKGTSAEGLAKGIYIVNGKKVIIK